jgi:hypothetical protein
VVGPPLTRNTKEESVSDNLKREYDDRETPEEELRRVLGDEEDQTTPVETEQGDALVHDLITRIGPIQDKWRTPDGWFGVALGETVPVVTWQSLLRRLVLGLPDDQTGGPTMQVTVGRVPGEGIAKKSEEYRRLMRVASNTYHAIQYKFQVAADRYTSETGQSFDWREYIRVQKVGTTIQAARRIGDDGLIRALPAKFVQHMTNERSSKEQDTIARMYRDAQRQKESSESQRESSRRSRSYGTDSRVPARALRPPPERRAPVQQADMGETEQTG